MKPAATVSRVNLMPPGRRDRVRRRAHLRFWSAVVLAEVVAVGILCLARPLIIGGDAEAAAREVTRLEGITLEHRGGIARLRNDLSQARVRYEAQRSIEHRPQWAGLLAVLAECRGEDIVLRSCRLLAQRDTGAVIRAPRFDLEVAGVGLTQVAVAEYVVRLERTSLFRSVKTLDTRIEPFLESQAVAFRILCSLDVEMPTLVDTAPPDAPPTGAAS